MRIRVKPKPFAEEVRLTLHELLARVTKRNIHGEVETGAPVGRETW